MIPALTVIDELLPVDKWHEIREEAIKAGFRSIYYMKAEYQGTGMEYLPKDIPIAISEFFGRPIDVKMMAFRLGHKDTNLHTNIHADNPISQFASVTYFNLAEDCKGGTAFYSHKEVGWRGMPTEEQLKEVGKDIEWMREQWQKPDNWRLDSIAGMLPNRSIVYPSQYFHSRYPLEGWGEEQEPEHARLVHVMFFNIK
jgi:hypothetical protein